MASTDKWNASVRQFEPFVILNYGHVLSKTGVEVLLIETIAKKLDFQVNYFILKNSSIFNPNKLYSNGHMER